MRIAVMGDRDTARAIANQFGGLSHLKSQLSAKKILAIQNGLQFGFSGSKAANVVQIERVGDDRYILRFYRQSFQGCPCIDDRESDLSSLVAAFEQFTKLKIR
jgi:hypothetical protein